MKLKRTILIDKPYLLLPIARDTDQARLTLSVAGQVVREAAVNLAGAAPDFWAPVEVGAWQGKRLSVSVDRLPAEGKGLEAIRLSDTPEDEGFYREPGRPQFHFTARRGWLNDPNGLVYYAGTWHLFFQHNPFGLSWGTMHWGHAASRDLVHWQEGPIAILPDVRGPAWSGSGVVDWDNTSGLQQGPERTLCLLYTAAGDPFIQCLVTSTDRGETWRLYPGNPVLGHVVGSNRDPKVVWDAERRQWVMALYLDGNDFGLFASPNLREWRRLSTVTVPESSECPDFFPMTVEGEPGVRKWVFTAANGHYLVGAFDGTTFTPEQPAAPCDWGANFYAAQTWSDAPEGRRVQVAWMSGGDYPGMPFNQQMSFPCDLTLRRFPDGLRLCRYPVREIEVLYGRKHEWRDQAVSPGANLLAGISGDLLDIEGEFHLQGAARLTLRVQGQEVVYDGHTLAALGRQAPLALPGGEPLRLRVLVDRTSLEVFANDRVSLTSWCPLGQGGLELAAEGGPARVVSLAVREMKSGWE